MAELQSAGEVTIEELLLYTSNGTLIDLRPFIAEINIYEDIFKHFIHGDILISDSINLIKNGPVVGQEILLTKITTPTFPVSIQKDFVIYKISERVAQSETTQKYSLSFASKEVIRDVNLPLYKSFSGFPHNIAKKIYFDFVASKRNYKISNDNAVEKGSNFTNFSILNTTSNKIKFVSPGWSPFKCINWLASKSIPKNEKAKNFIFFENNKSFVFGSVEKLFDIADKAGDDGKGTYFYGSASNIRKSKFAPDINREMFMVKSVNFVENIDYLNLYDNGYFSNRMLTVDVYNKKVSYNDYNYIKEYPNQTHTSGSSSAPRPVFGERTLTNPASFTSFYPVNPKLFDNFPGNVSEKMGDIFGNRRSSLLDLSNIKLNIIVPGRTDLQVGSMIDFLMPDLTPNGRERIRSKDEFYSGKYLITAIHHNIKAGYHFMSMEIIKDSLTS